MIFFLVYRFRIQLCVDSEIFTYSSVFCLLCVCVCVQFLCPCFSVFLCMSGCEDELPLLVPSL